MFMTSKNINFKAMQHRLATIWRPGKGVTIEELGDRLILFRFYHERDLRWVIERGPWSFDNALLVMRELKPGDLPTTVTLTSTEFWIQVHDVPAAFCTERVGKILGDYVGEYLAFDEKHRYTADTPYMRIRVRFDVTAPLVKGRKVRRPGGNWLMSKFRYERLPVFCYVCGRIGHIEHHCELWYDTPEDQLVRGWDAELRAELRRNEPHGGEQWLVSPSLAQSNEGSTQERQVLGELSNNMILASKPKPANVQALLGNLGVRAGGWRTPGSEDVKDFTADMEGVELPEDRKRRRGDSNSGTQFNRNNFGSHDPKNVVQAGPGSGTCPSQ
ncbi:Uncharacterized protein At4g02000 [Linum perenne]